MEKWSQWIYEVLGIGHSYQYKIIATIVVGLVIYILRRMLLHFILKGKEDVKAKYNWSKSISYVGYFLTMLVVIPIWITELESFGTFLGLLTAGLAVALKEPISNFFAWIFIISKKPFEMGDRIQIGNSEGDILDISFFQFTMLEIKNWVEADQSTGRIVHVPNGLIFTHPVYNYNQAMNYIWNEIPVMVTFESNWKKAKKILLEVEEKKLKPLVSNMRSEMRKGREKYYVHYTNFDPTVYTTIKKNGVMLTLRYLCHPKTRRTSEQAAIEEILEQFYKHDDIQFAYPTTRFFDASKE
ncbi:MAG TPA: mechanosensitive ion channel family protein [Bacteroidetes bacterium]|nr:mechanosensitive ion channel family protein [Bacteroidota bacterium]